MRFAKHIHVLHLLSQIPAPEKEYYSRPASSYDAGHHGPYVWSRNKQVMTTEDACAAFDHLFEYLHKRWAEPMSAMDAADPRIQITAASKHEVLDCAELLVMKEAEFIAKLESLPPYFAEHIFPVAVARYMLRDLAMPINHRKCSQFKEFHRRYGPMILMA